MSLDPGQLNHRVRIERLDDLRDSAGNVIQDPQTGAVSRGWVEVVTVWAKIAPLSAREFIQSAATQSEITSRIVIWQRHGLTADMRLVHLVNGQPGKIYNPRGFLADPDTGLEYLTIPCAEGVSDGQ